MSTHNMFSLRNKKDISIFRMKKTSYLLLCPLIGLQTFFFSLKLPQDPYYMSANSKGFGKTALKRRLV